MMKRRNAQRGFSLIEVSISMAILAVGILGVAQMQILASNQNGLARRTSRAAAIARDFVETAQRWQWGDPRLVGTAGENMAQCGSPWNQFPIREDDLGNLRTPALKLDFTAEPDSNPIASYLASKPLGLGYGLTNNVAELGRFYAGAAPRLLELESATDADGFQLGWTVRDINPATPECEALLVNVVVRYPTGVNQQYRNLVTSFVQYNPAGLAQAGTIAEQF